MNADQLAAFLDQAKRTNAQLSEMERRHQEMADRIAQRHAAETARIEALEREIANIVRFREANR